MKEVESVYERHYKRDCNLVAWSNHSLWLWSHCTHSLIVDCLCLSPFVVFPALGFHINLYSLLFLLSLFTF